MARFDSSGLVELQRIGWSSAWADALAALDPGGASSPARAAEEHKGGYRLLAPGGELWGEISGRLHYVSDGPLDLPGVGDWVAVAPQAGGERGVIHHVLPRRTCLVRKVPDRPARAQLLAANVDTVFVVSSANHEFNPRRIERILALVRESGSAAVVVISKLDLAEAIHVAVDAARAVAPGVPVLALSALTGDGVSALAPYLTPGATVALIGSSGVGKSTLANRLLGTDHLATGAIRADDKGRHTTSHRELIALPSGAVLIDAPGLREVGLWEDDGAVDAAFPEVEALIGDCRFSDCMHDTEPGCAVVDALETGALDPARYDSYRKLKREAAQVRLKRDAHARHEHRQERKRFSKMLRRRPDKRDPR